MRRRKGVKRGRGVNPEDQNHKVSVHSLNVKPVSTACVQRTALFFSPSPPLFLVVWACLLPSPPPNLPSTFRLSSPLILLHRSLSLSLSLFLSPVFLTTTELKYRKLKAALSFLDLLSLTLNKRCLTFLSVCGFFFFLVCICVVCPPFRVSSPLLSFFLCRAQQTK